MVGILTVPWVSNAWRQSVILLRDGTQQEDGRSLGTGIWGKYWDLGLFPSLLASWFSRAKSCPSSSHSYIHAGQSSPRPEASGPSDQILWNHEPKQTHPFVSCFLSANGLYYFFFFFFRPVSFLSLKFFFECLICVSTYALYLMTLYIIQSYINTSPDKMVKMFDKSKCHLALEKRTLTS